MKSATSNTFRADLHCHSTCSDGTFSPIELLNLAKSLNLNGLSITDHDTIEAYETAIPHAQAIDLPLIPGVEFSATHQKTSVHILGYAFDLGSSALSALCKRHKMRRTKRNQAILEKLAKHNMPIKEEELSQDTSTVGRPHIAQAMVRRGFALSINDAFKRFLGENKLCYAQGDPVSAEETIDTIHEAGGLAIIAHPHLMQSRQVMKELLNMPFDGMECYYCRFPASHHEKWIKIAKEKNWLITGGSDFHGDVKPEISLGISFVDEETFTKIQNHA